MGLWFAFMRIFGFRRTLLGLLALFALRMLLRRRQRQTRFAA